MSEAISKNVIDFRPAGTPTSDQILEAFLEAVEAKGISLYEAQEEAIMELMEDQHVILNTPTGSGKSLVALALHFKALCEGKRVFYTSPIKALVSEKFFSLCDDLGAENVGMMTGDASVNRSAPIVCCTAEILANIALREAENAPLEYVIMDEFHYYSDKERGVAWQVPLLTMPHVRFLLMSATLGSTKQIEESLEQITGAPVVKVTSTDRPVPLDYKYLTTPVHETIENLISSNKSPIYVVNFTQRACAEQAQSLMSLNFCTKEHKQKIKDFVKGFKFDTAYGKDVRRYLMHGLGLHHAGLLPKYRLLTEQLAQAGLLKVICGTDTLGVGVNVPIRTVLFNQLCKYNGEKTAILSVRDFKQISGRAGRKGFDDEGSVVVQAPEHVIENLRIDAKIAGAEGKKKKKFVKKKPPTRGYVHYDEKTFEMLQTSEPEALKSAFRMTHGTVINVIQGHDDGYQRLKKLIKDSHGDTETKERQRRLLQDLIDSLEGAGLLVSEVVEEELQLTVREDLQIDFSLNHSLSLYLIESLSFLDTENEDFSLDIMTLVEAILEHPKVILRKQVDAAKTKKMTEMKAEGIEYDQRIEELDKVEHPKPKEQFIYDTFNHFREKHPWIEGENIKPKSICREMFESYLSFHEYIKEYGLSRSEGILLRYISQFYHALIQTIPENYWDDNLNEIIAYFRTMLLNVDSSLLQEWESMRNEDESSENDHQSAAINLRADRKGFKAYLKVELHALVKALSEQDYEEALKYLHNKDDWSELKLKERFSPFYEDYERIVFDHNARFGDKQIVKSTGKETFSVRQVLLDPEEDNTWALSGYVDLSTVEGDRPLFVLEEILS